MRSLKYRANVMSPDGKRLEYGVPNISKITGVKYRWDVGNAGKAGVRHAVAVFDYPEDLPETDDLVKISDAEYDAFCNVSLSTDRGSIAGDGAEEATITASFPEGGEEASFVITKPDGEQQIIKRPIPPTGMVVLPFKSAVKGRARISLRSDKWHSAAGLGSVEIEVI